MTRGFDNPIKFTRAPGEQESHSRLLAESGFLSPVERIPSPADANPSSLDAIGSSDLHGYIEDLPEKMSDAPLPQTEPGSDGSWQRGQPGDDLECAAEVKGFAVRVFGFTVFQSLEYKRSALCQARQMVDATCEYADLKGRALSLQRDSSKTEADGKAVLESSALCLSSMRAASQELAQSTEKVDRRIRERAQATSGQCAVSQEPFVRRMLGCEASAISQGEAASGESDRSARA